MSYPNPQSLEVEHHGLHVQLERVIQTGGEVGAAASAVADRLHAHFVGEERYALPPLALLPLFDPLLESWSRRRLGQFGMNQDDVDRAMRELGKFLAANGPTKRPVLMEHLRTSGFELEQEHARLDRHALRLVRAVAMQRVRHGQRLETLQASLRGLDPQQVLTRGYAWLTDETGRVVQTVAQLRPGARVGAVLADGDALLQVDEVHPRPRT